MPSFPSTPKPAAVSLKPVYTFNETQFGDGYSQRASSGLNGEKKVFTVDWESVSQSDATTFMSFLSARKGYEAFDWVDTESNTHQVICKNWNYQRRKNLYSFQMEFEQVFDL